MIGSLLVLAGCSGSGSERQGESTGRVTTRAAEAPGRTLYTIEANTQAVLRRVALGVGNIWEEEYTPAGGTRSRGLTAGVWISVRDDESKNRHLRVHPGQEFTVRGYRMRVLTVEENSIRLAVTELRPGS